MPKGYSKLTGLPVCLGMKRLKLPWNKGLKMPMISGQNHPMWGKHHTSEAKEKNRQAHLGKGHPQTMETRLKISQAHKGMKFTEEHRRNIGLAAKGRIPWNKGRRNGKYNEKTLIMQSEEYKNWRRKVFERDHFQCQWCGKKQRLEADHILPFAYFPKYRFYLDNGRTLCVECHRKTDTYGCKARKNYAHGVRIVQCGDVRIRVATYGPHDWIRSSVQFQAA